MDWDRYFYNICEAVASKSACLSRQIGVILVRDHSIISTGYNGPPRGIPHCGHDRYIKDSNLFYAAQNYNKNHDDVIDLIDFRSKCPRKVLNYKSGTHMEVCPAQHAEENAVTNAARNGVSVLGCILYMNCIVPCKNCFGTLINAGIVEIVITENVVYDEWTQFLIGNSGIKIREFNLD